MTPARQHVGPAALLLLLGSISSCSSCGSCNGCGEAQSGVDRDKPAQGQALTAEPQSQRADAGGAQAAQRNLRKPAPGWSRVDLHDQVPLCVFSSHEERHKTLFQGDAQPQTLRAGDVVWFGAFAPFCVHESCDQIPSLQCWVDREDSTLIVHSRYWGHRRDDADCISDCRPINAACPTPELEAGTYTVRYGDRSFELRIPSDVASPCFRLE